MARRRAAPTVPPVLTARPFELLFIDGYERQAFSDATAVYQRLRPQVKYETAASQACRLLKKPQVVAELARRMQQKHGVTRSLIESDLLVARQLALNSKDPLAIASVSMDMAKLAGLLVEKREVKDVTEKEQHLRNLVRQSFAPSLASTLTPSAPSATGSSTVETN